MADAFVHRFRWEDTEKEREELRFTDPREVSTPRKETVEVRELKEISDEVVAQIKEIKYPLKNLLEGEHGSLNDEQTEAVEAALQEARVLKKKLLKEEDIDG